MRQLATAALVVQHEKFDSMQRQQPRHREGDKKGEVKHSREGFVRELADKIRNKKKGRVATVTPTVRVEGF